MTRFQQDVLAQTAALPHGPDCVDDVPGRESVAAGNFCFAGGAAPQRATFVEQFDPCSAVDGAIHAAATEQSLIVRVDDRVDALSGDFVCTTSILIIFKLVGVLRACADMSFRQSDEYTP